MKEKINKDEEFYSKGLYEEGGYEYEKQKKENVQLNNYIDSMWQKKKCLNQR